MMEHWDVYCIKKKADLRTLTLQPDVVADAACPAQLRSLLAGMT